MGEQKLSPEIISLLEVACDEKIEKFDLLVHKNHGAATGYLGEMVFVSLTNKITGKPLHFVVKKAFQAETSTTEEMMRTTFFNEIHFYKNIWPTLNNFQKKIPGVQIFDKIPKFYVSTTVPGKEKLVIENLFYSGFEMFPRDSIFPNIHVKLLLKSFGQFHGISAAFRELHPEETRKLRDELMNTECVFKQDDLAEVILGSLRELQNMVENEKIKEKLERYTTKGIQIGIDSWQYNGKNPVFNHGDCWSNNVMFKLDNNGTPIDLRLIDFQFCRYGSVVSDLAHILYSESARNIFDEFDNYLKIYYDSFSKTLRNFSLDPSNIFTFEDLKNEWKDHCVYGFVMGQTIWSKHRVKIEKDEVRKALLKLVQHLYDNEYL